MAPDAIGAVVEMSGQRLYFSGDTAFRPELFRRVADLRPSVAALSINGQFGNMNAREGAEAACLTGASVAIPCHCWTFAEHGGNPGKFCEYLQGQSLCRPLCFRQGEIQILDRAGRFRKRKETAS
jgi:L-ascorbate 6-phosphate lactonase